MNRRQFIAAGAALAAGCRQKAPPLPPPPGPPTLSDEERDRIVREAAARRKHLADLVPFRAGTGEVRTTPPAPADIAAAIPELKTRLKAAQRLHPRFGEEPPPGGSKLGGKILWPATEPWPIEPASRLPLTAVLQLRGPENWNRTEFRPGCDLCQLFWLPRDPVAGELHAVAFWRFSNQVADRELLDPPGTDLAFPSLVPVPCRLHPEWIGELPDWETLRRTDLRPRLAEWKPPDDSKLDNVKYYTRFLSAAHGSKVGGWPRDSLSAPACKLCQWAMDYFCTIDTTEWSPEDARRWRPVEDADDALGRRAACGLSVAGGSAVEVHICRRCPTWPVRAMVVK